MKTQDNARQLLILVMLVVIFAVGCRKKESDSPVIPLVKTDSVSDVGLHTAVAYGTVSNDGGAGISVRGICWGKAPDPSLSDSVRSLGPAPGQFNCSLDGLEAGTTYYVRAFATNAAGTGYGASVMFATHSVQVPVVVTNPVTEIKLVTATGSGTVLDNGGSPVMARGFCYSTHPAPTVADTTTAGGNENIFSGAISGLKGGTTYYLRAFATNSIGTGYGNEITFSTVPVTVKDISNNLYNVIQIGNQVWMRENLKVKKLNDGGYLSESGMTWAYYPNLPAYLYNSVYGHSYNKAAATNIKLAPIGWHVPTDADWAALFTYLGGAAVAGGKLKETGFTHWNSPNTGADNTSDFTALPGGYLTAWAEGSIGGIYYNYVRQDGNFWSSAGTAVHLTNTTTAITTGYTVNNGGFSVRCIKD